MVKNHITEFDSILTHIRRRWTTNILLRLFGHVGLALSLIVVMAVVVEAVWQPTDLPLIVLALVTCCMVATFLVWLFCRTCLLPDNRKLARFVEECIPELGDSFASAAEVVHSLENRAIGTLVLADTIARLREVDLERVISRAQLFRMASYGVVTLTSLIFVLSLAVEPGQRVTGAVRLYAFPENVLIKVEPGDLKVVEGQSIRIRATLAGVSAASGRTRPILELNQTSGWREIDMEPVDDGYEFELTSVRDSFNYRVRAASAKSNEYSVIVLTAPRVERIDVEYEYPLFTGLESRVEMDGGDIYAPPGTKVTLFIHANKGVHEGDILLDNAGRLDLVGHVDGPSVLEGTFEISGNDSYQVNFTDVDGLNLKDEMKYFVRAINDRPPEVRFLRPAADRSVTQLEEVTVEVLADDDYGFEKFELVYSVGGGNEKIIPFKYTLSSTELVEIHTLYLEDMKVQPGDFVTYYARVRDVNRAKASVESRSDIFFLDVMPFEQEFELAQSQQQTGSSNSGLDDLIAAQKEIIIATWKFERQNSLDEGMLVVARAQGELRALVRQIGGLSDRRVRQADARNQTGRINNPLILADQAMASAENWLGKSNSAKALPFEMEALSQLLKAQVENRRRQVSQQRMRAGGGSGQSTVDLSALFDRELQREQQTNYELRSQGSQVEEKKRSESLERVRELARRQNAISQEQRLLERQRAQMHVEEMRRQLNRMTREQNELRSEVEELRGQLGDTRRMASTLTNSSDLDDRIRNLSEAMRSVTSNLRREDLPGVGLSSDDALAQLRNLEHELRKYDSEEWTKLLKELHLEAQQLADAQQRLEMESHHLAQGEANPESRNQRASVQRRLAERTETFERDVQSVASSAVDELATVLEPAVREFREARVPEQIRESVTDMLALFDPENAAISEEQLRNFFVRENEITEALNRVTERIGAASYRDNAAADRFSEQLAQSSDLRDRLAPIARQIEALSSNQLTSNNPSAGEEPSLTDLLVEYDRALHATQDLLDELRRGNSDLDQRLANQVENRRSVSAPGTQAFKQDYSQWEALRRDVELALERFDARRSEYLANEEMSDSVNAGADDRMPEEYRNLVDTYFRSLVSQKPR